MPIEPDTEPAREPAAPAPPVATETELPPPAAADAPPGQAGQAVKAVKAVQIVEPKVPANYAAVLAAGTARVAAAR